MSYYRENDVWQSPDGTWSIGFYEVTRPAEDEWDQEFGPDFGWVSTGHPTPEAAMRSWDGANPGGHQEFSLANSLAADIAHRDDLAADLEDRLIAEYGSTASRWGNGPYSGSSKRNDPASLARRTARAFAQLREVDAAEHHYRLNGYANTVDAQRKDAAARLADLRARALETSAMSARAMGRLEDEDRAERLKDLRKLKARDADRQAGSRGHSGYGGGYGFGGGAAPGRADALRALDAAIAELEPKAAQAPESEPVQAPKAKAKAKAKARPAARATRPAMAAGPQDRDAIGRFAASAHPPADLADVPLPEDDPWGRRTDYCDGRVGGTIPVPPLGMTRTDPARHVAGTPGMGGKFAPEQRAAAAMDDIDIDPWTAPEAEPEPEPPRGSVDHVQVGSRTPWGPADSVEHSAPGIVRVGTAGHGGVKLSPERNADIPPALRNASGWYDEDAECHIVAMHHPEGFAHDRARDLDAIRADGRQGVIRNFPDKYERATGETIPFGVSGQKDLADYYSRMAGQTLIATTGATESRTFPGYVDVGTRVHGQPGSGRHLVPVEAYRSAPRSHGAANGLHPALPPGSIDITPPAPDPEPPQPRYRGVDASGLTERQRARAEAELSQRWRGGDGRIFTLQDRIDRGDITGKTTAMPQSGNVPGYYLKVNETPEGTPGGSSNVVEVSLATWKAVQAPDDRPESRRLADDATRAYAAMERAGSSGDLQARQRARARHADLRERSEAARQQEEAVEAPRRAAATAERERIAREAASAAYRAATGKEPSS